MIPGVEKYSFNDAQYAYGILSAKLLLRAAPHQGDGSYDYSKTLPSGKQVRLSSYWSFLHADYQPGVDPLLSDTAVLYCESVANPLSEHAFIFQPHLINPGPINGEALQSLSSTTPENGYTIAAIDARNHRAYHLGRLTQNELVLGLLED